VALLILPVKGPACCGPTLLARKRQLWKTALGSK
jgi:hypothetical protein